MDNPEPRTEPTSKKTRRTIVLWAVSFPISFLMILFILHRLDLAAVLQNFTKADRYDLALLAALASLHHLILLPIKIRWILSVDKMALSFTDALIIRLTGLSLKFLVPYRLGEAASIVYLRKRYNYHFGRGFGFVAFDKLTVLAGLAFLITIGALGTRGFHLWAFPAGLIFIMLVVAATTGLIAKTRSLLNRFPKPVQSFADGVVHLFDHSSQGARLSVLLYSIALMAYDMLYYYIAFRAIGLPISFAHVLLTMPLVTLLTAVPLPADGIGFREGAVILLMSGFGTSEQLFAAGALVSFFEIVLFAVIGVFFFLPFFMRLGNHK